MARLTEHGLRRSVGVSGLFATAYGNVGSSIYYALGLVAAHALGLTPLVFLFAGGLFVLTAKTYAEGDRKSTRLNSSHSQISYAVFWLKKISWLLDRLAKNDLRPSAPKISSCALYA